MRLHRTITELEKRGEIEEAKRLRRQLQQLPSRDRQDPGYRRLRYIRYADDWLLGFTGPRREAEQIKNEVGRFLHDRLHLELSPTKTLITHGRTQSARFLGYEIVVLDNDSKHDHRGHRSINAQIGLKVPADVIRAKCALYLHHGRPIRRTERTVNSDFSIVAQYQAEFRGIAGYYQLAVNLHRLDRLKYVMQRSLVKTLARKYRVRTSQVYRRYRAVLHTDHGPRRGLQVTVERAGKPPLVAQWGGISLARKIRIGNLATIRSRSGTVDAARSSSVCSPMPARCADPTTTSKCTTFDTCVTCTSRDGQPGLPGSSKWPRANARPWSSAAPATRTSTTTDAHPGRNHEHHDTGEPDAVNAARPVREGAVGKGPQTRAPRRRPTSLPVRF
jgi:hypothetical protein